MTNEKDCCLFPDFKRFQKQKVFCSKALSRKLLAMAKKVPLLALKTVTTGVF
jgi:hypothetical protein